VFVFILGRHKGYAPLPHPPQRCVLLLHQSRHIEKHIFAFLVHNKLILCFCRYWLTIPYILRPTCPTQLLKEEKWDSLYW